jgi:small subunit ribosomal protein S27Ae
MAAAKKEKKPHTLYEISGSAIKRKNRSCPKCGPGYSMAKHKDRTTCGKCGYTEFVSKK